MESFVWFVWSYSPHFRMPIIEISVWLIFPFNFCNTTGTKTWIVFLLLDYFTCLVFFSLRKKNTRKKKKYEKKGIGCAKPNHLCDILKIENAHTHYMSSHVLRCCFANWITNRKYNNESERVSFVTFVSFACQIQCPCQKGSSCLDQVMHQFNMSKSNVMAFIDALTMYYMQHARRYGITADVN